MREIKFRAWDVVEKKFYFDVQDAYDYMNDIPATNFADMLEPDSSFVVEQFTGLRDKNGVEIYEGDIVVRSYDPIVHIFTGAVKWIHRLTLGWSLVASDGDDYIMMTDDLHEVIGNIHQNPELLDPKP